MKTLIVCALALIPLTTHAQNTQVAGLAGLPNHPFLYVEGEAQIQKAPDLIVFRFQIRARNADQGKANKEVQTKAAKVFALLKDAHVKDSDIVAQDILAEEDYEIDPADRSRRGKKIGYVVTRPFQVAIRDLTKYGPLGDAIMNLDNVDFSYISGNLSERQKLEEELWPKAIANAREKAEKTLKPLGMKIDSVFAVSSIAYGEIASEFLKSGARVIVTGMNIPTPPDRPSQYRLEMINVASNAHIIYLISPAN